MYYELFAKKISELNHLLKKNRALQHSSVHQESFSKMKKNLVAEIISLIKDAPIKKALVPEYLKLKKMNQLEILQALWKAENAGYITFELWSLLMDLEVAAFQGNLLEVTNLLENDDLKAIAASNSNCVLRIAALQNQQTLIEYLLFIESIRYVANHVPLIKSQAEVSAVARLTSFLNTAKNFEKEASAYFQSIKELLSAGNITDLDWKLLPLVLSFEKVPRPLFKEVVSFITVMPSVRLRAQQDADFSELLFQTKQWLKNNSAKPCPQDVPRVGPHIVKLGVSAFNLLAYEKFLEEKAYKDKLREHFTESYLEKHCPERFPPKAPTDLYHSITIQNSKVRYNGVRRGKIK